MDIDPVVVINENGATHVGFMFNDLLFSHERCNIDDIKEIEVLNDADYYYKTVEETDPERCGICWPK